MSATLAREYGFKISNTSSKFKVRLANGRVVETGGQVITTLFFGEYSCTCKFFVLDCPVPLILGM